VFQEVPSRENRETETNPTKPTELSITQGENKNLLDNNNNSAFEILKSANAKNLKVLEKIKEKDYIKESSDRDRDLLGLKKKSDKSSLKKSSNFNKGEKEIEIIDLKNSISKASKSK